MPRPVYETADLSETTNKLVDGISDSGKCSVTKNKKIRRAKKKKNQAQIINIMYSNIQGVTKKKESLVDIMEELDCDLCLLAETMTRTVKINGCRCITASKSVGQNVCIIVRNKLVSNDIVKLYEPNDTVNMIGIRIELMNSCMRIYTAHLKQQSSCSREDIGLQFEEIRKQFQYATGNNEGIIMIFDANVHVGKDVIRGCIEKQDWGGKLMMEIIKEENLVLLNTLDLCNGIITRIDPSNGNGSTIDLAICNQYLLTKILEMNIDEEGKFKPTNYGTSKIKKTDHNTISIRLKMERCPKTKPCPYVNLNDELGREAFKCFLEDGGIENILNNRVECNIEMKFDIIMELWSEAVDASFKKILPKRQQKSGITSDIRALMKEEKWIRENVLMNPERGCKIAEITKRIRRAIGKNRAEEISVKVSQIRQAKNPQSEIYKVRRERKKLENTGFPLKDGDGNMQVSKEGVDSVIVTHFEKVFSQNPVPEGDIWMRYWKLTDEIFNILVNKEQGNGGYTPPTVDEIRRLVVMTDDKKAVLGTMKSDLIKLGGEQMIRLIHRFLLMCCENEDIPEKLRVEKMVLLYKNSGELSLLDNYRGIFIRNIFLSVLQKWLYMKCSPVIDKNGSELAFGGRKGRSVKEVLLIVRLIQDHCIWTKQPLILKFLDVAKFFDTMNYKKCLIEAYRSGIRGKYWKMYKAINERKRCIPYTPLGECPSLDVNEVFLQGSCDAMLMAWNLVDSINKSKEDMNDPVVVIEGVQIPRLLFVDDLLEMARSFDDIKITITENETFEKANRLKFKQSKCKIICMNCEPECVKLNDVELEVVNDHKYLGTMISSKGRRSDLEKRISDCKGVLNEIVEVCKTGCVSVIRLEFVMMLIEACFKSKFKHGCEVWDSLNKTNKGIVNKLIPETLKRVLEVPKSTPTNAVIHDLGVVDMDLEIEMERILLANKVNEMNSDRVVKRLFLAMYNKKVPGFCVMVDNALALLGINNLSELTALTDKRKSLKEHVVKAQSKRLIEGMIKASKTDSLLLNYDYDGKMKSYLLKLPFDEARIIFLLRARMFPTRANFPKRWSASNLCVFCCGLDTDEHLFQCCGYMDLHDEMVDYNMFIKLSCDMDMLSVGAKMLIKLHDRLLCANEDSDINDDAVL